MEMVPCKMVLESPFEASFPWAAMSCHPKADFQKKPPVGFEPTTSRLLSGCSTN